MADYSAMKYYLEKNNLHYFTFSQNSEKPIKAVTVTFLLTRQWKVFPTALGTKAHLINVRQMTATPTAPNGHTHLEPLLLFFVTSIRNIKVQKIYKLNSLKHIIIKVELYRVQTDLMQCCNCQNFGHVRVNCKLNPLDVSGAVVAPSIRNIL
jgi:hypothetical protein